MSKIEKIYTLILSLAMAVIMPNAVTSIPNFVTNNKLPEVTNVAYLPVISTFNKVDALSKDDKYSNMIDNFEKPEVHFESENLIYGDYGSIVVGSYNAGLYGDLRRYDMSLDKYIDLENAAPVYTLYNGIPYIPDHNYQGFDETNTNDTLYIYKNDGTYTKYTKLETKYDRNRDWYCDGDGFDVYTQYHEADLITQTCAEVGLIFHFWKAN